MAEPRQITSVPRLPRRDREGHKGHYGRVLVVGGSRGMPGAVALAANAALRGGAGLVSFAAPEPVQLAIAGLCPCATSYPLPCEGGELAPQAMRAVREAADECDVVAVGPGLGIGGPQEALVRAALEFRAPLVLDADALNNLARTPDWWAKRRTAAVLTPHPGEFARLTGRTVADIQNDRPEAAYDAACAWARPGDGPLVVVLKGAGTVVTDGESFYINETGNPGMATGGAGDVLTGLTAALMGQGLPPFAAACLAAWAHGRAGDLAAAALGEASVTAADLLDHLPAAMREAVE